MSIRAVVFNVYKLQTSTIFIFLFADWHHLYMFVHGSLIISAESRPGNPYIKYGDCMGYAAEVAKPN